MKLICCTKCSDVVKLIYEEPRQCQCGSCGGQYLRDGLHAKVWGEKNKFFVLGFANSSLISAIKNQIDHGDSTEIMYYNGKMESKGREFTAFIIPESASSVERLDQKPV